MPLRRFDDQDFDNFVRAKFEEAHPASYDIKAWNKLNAKRGGKVKFWIAGLSIVLIMLMGFLWWNPFGMAPNLIFNESLLTINNEIVKNRIEPESQLDSSIEKIKTPVIKKESVEISETLVNEQALDDVHNEKLKTIANSQKAVNSNQSSDKSVSKKSSDEKSNSSKKKVVEQANPKETLISQKSNQIKNSSVTFQKNTALKDDSDQGNFFIKDKSKSIEPILNDDRDKTEFSKAEADNKDFQIDDSQLLFEKEFYNKIEYLNPKDQTSIFVVPKIVYLRNENANAEKQILNKEETITGKEKVRDKFILSFLLNTDFSTVKFNDFTSPGSGLGLRLSYSLSNRLTLNGGITRTSRIYDVNDRADYSLSQWILNNQGWPEGINAKCNITEIPIGIRYDLIKGNNWNFYGQLSSSTFLMDREIYDFQLTDSQATAGALSRWEVESQNKHVFNIIGATIGYEKYFTRRFGLGVEIYWQTTIDGIGIYSVDLNSLGNQFLLNYKF